MSKLIREIRRTCGLDRGAQSKRRRPRSGLHAEVGVTECSNRIPSSAQDAPADALNASHWRVRIGVSSSPFSSLKLCKIDLFVFLRSALRRSQTVRHLASNPAQRIPPNSRASGCRFAPVAATFVNGTATAFGLHSVLRCQMLREQAMLLWLCSEELLGAEEKR